jgi:hypothetical protein
MIESLDATRLVDMDSVMAQQEGEPVQLLQIAGNGVNRTFRVLPLQRVTIGRGDDSTIYVDEAGVSRRHALIEFQEGTPRLIDLGSTNGTFVNGERIDTCPLQTGDQIQIALAVFEVSIGKSGAHQAQVERGSDPGLKEQIEQLQEKLKGQPTGSGQITVQTTVLAGNLENIGLASLLQVLQANGNTGSLLIHREGSVGRIHLEKGRPIHARLGRMRGRKALDRLMARSDGHFELVSPGFEPDHATVEGSLQSILLDSAKELDELKEYRKALPPDDATLLFSSNRTIILGSIPPDLFEVLATISRHRKVGVVFDECNISDLSVCRHLLMLLNKEIIGVEPGQDE